ncbi:DUF924 family protein [Variovorax sp. YR752]|uniref:DUF924 family protein n=1 Tax=Variovorax sp. YR752 TaxID=1884383 RepID=UPI0031380B4C
MQPDARAVLDFWFGDQPAARAEWFRKDPAFDAQIRERFGALVEAVLAGASFGDSAAERLARIVVLDQFTRNTFRDTPRAFAGDGLARSLAQAMTEVGDDLQLPPWQRAFAYLPFEHAEDEALQDVSVRCFEALAQEAPALRDMLDYALKHREVIRRFGRFPHRNTILGRKSTAEELAFLEQPGSRF